MDKQEIKQTKSPKLPVSEQETQIQAPSLWEKIQVQKKKILIGLGVFVGILILAGAVFGVYKYAQNQISIARPEPSRGEPTERPTPVATPTQESTVIEIPQPSPMPSPLKKQIDLNGYYIGEISLQVPYKELKFLEIDVHNFNPFETQLNENDYHYQDAVIDGYTFVAEKGEDFEFVAYEDRDSNPGSFIQTELYGWGPTVVRMDTTIGWGVPATTRYFYVVKGKDFYGPNFITSDGTTFNGSKYGRYRLEITQRK